MLKQCRETIYLAWRDWKFETLISLCAVLALASMLTPLLVLQGLKNGVTEGMRERLLRDPATLIITPKSDAGKYTAKDIENFSKLPGAAYAIGRIRATATDVTLYNGNKKGTIALEPSSSGEPVLARYKIAAPKDGSIPEIVLSTPAAKMLSADVHTKLSMSLARRTPEGKLESLPVEFVVSGILPLEAAERRLGFIPFKALADFESYRDYIAVPERNFSGNPRTGEQTWASFRIYADDLDHVDSVAQQLSALNIETVTRARDIKAIKSLESAINQVILIISLAVGAGFAAFMFSSSEGAIRRKQRMLGILRLFGIRRLPLTLYPLTQTLLTAIAGFCLAIFVYWIVAECIAKVFAANGGIACHMGIADFMFAVLIVLGISAIASVRAAWQAANMEPSSVIREI